MVAVKSIKGGNHTQVNEVPNPLNFISTTG